MLLWLAAEGDDQDTSTTDATATEGNLETAEVEATEPIIPDKYVIDGEELTVEQIREFKKGHMRQSDYTRKTQEIARSRQEHAEALELYEYLRQNPELAQELADRAPEVRATNLTSDPRLQELDMKVRTMEIEKALGVIRSSMPEVNEIEILQLATDKRLSIEDAFEQWKGKNMDKIVESKVKAKTEQLADRIKTNGQTTRTLMNPTLKPPDNLGLSANEVEFARKIDMPLEEYKKYKTYKR